MNTYSFHCYNGTGEKAENHTKTTVLIGSVEGITRKLFSFLCLAFQEIVMCE